MTDGFLRKFWRFILPRPDRDINTSKNSVDVLQARIVSLEDRLSEAQRQLRTAAQAQAEYTAFRQEVSERFTKLEAFNVSAGEHLEELGAELSVIRQPEAVRPAQKLIALLLQHKKPLPDDIHEHVLRLELRENPFDPNLTYSMVALLRRLDRAPMPNPANLPSQDLPPPAPDAETLWRQATDQAEAEDTIGFYAALWQAALRNPDDARGWGEFARGFATRGEWANCREALRIAFGCSGKQSGSAADAILSALSILASRQELDTLEWKPWLASLPANSRANPKTLHLLLSAREQEQAVRLLPEAMKRDEKSALAWLAAGKLAFHAGRVDESFDCLLRALDLDLPKILHHIVRDYGAQVSVILSEPGKADRMAALISARTTAHPGLNLLPPLPSPEALASARRIRQQALDRGLPSAVLVTLGKSASVSIGAILSSGFHLPTVLYSLINYRVIPEWAKDFSTGGGIYVTHLKALAENVDALAQNGNSKAIVLIRDPRQAMISTLHHVRKYREDVLPGERDIVDGADETALDYLIETYLPASIEWIDQWAKADGKISVDFMTFESFVQDRKSFADRLISSYGGDTKFFDREAAFRVAEGVDYHRRLGSVDEWRGRLTARQIERVNNMMPAYFWNKFSWVP